MDLNDLKLAGLKTAAPAKPGRPATASCAHLAPPQAFDAPHANSQEAWMQVDELAHAYCSALQDRAMQHAAQTTQLELLDFEDSQF